MNQQFDTVFKIFVDIYGMPKWETNPKEGQSKDEIIDMWCKELKPYTVGQCKEAAYRLCKYRKASTFPSISHLMAELVDDDKLPEKQDKNAEAERCYAYVLKNGTGSVLAAQRAIYRIYGVEMGGYKHSEDKAV